jgi:hypothetical protein
MSNLQKKHNRNKSSIDKNTLIKNTLENSPSPVTKTYQKLNRDNLTNSPYKVKIFSIFFINYEITLSFKKFTLF